MERGAITSSAASKSAVQSLQKYVRDSVNNHWVRMWVLLILMVPNPVNGTRHQ